MQACTLATALKAQGYATGQFGKNHLGDLNKYLPRCMVSMSSSDICIT
jgi:arylsulfatase A-like enzyme